MRNPNLVKLEHDYRNACRRLDRLHDTVYQGNADVKSAYEQCRNALENAKEILDRYLNQLATQTNEDEEAYLCRCAADALSTLNRLIQSAEDSIRNIHSIPPFFY